VPAFFASADTFDQIDGLTMKRLLIVYHTQFGGTKQLAETAWRGAQSIQDVDSVLKRAADAGIDDIIGADAILLRPPRTSAWQACS
jgi:hypothetical protein